MMNDPAPYTSFDRQPIAGAWRTGSSGKRLQDRNPWNGELLLEIPQASPDDLETAYRGAAKAAPAWAATPPGERAAVMRRAATLMQARRGEIVGWLVREAGSTRLKANLEWQAVHALMLEAATLPWFIDGHIEPADPGGHESRVHRKPVGVVGVISPWHCPLQLAARSVLPALAVGNAVVTRPSSDTPVTGGLLLAKLLEEASLPEGVLSVVVGGSRDIVEAFVKHAVPRVISFNGSMRVGRSIARLAADAPILKRLALELGGSGVLAVLADADLDRAVEAALFGRFLHQGQICMSVSRLIVDSSIHDEFVDRFVQRVRALKIGDAAAPDTMIGPIINERRLERLQERIASASGEGAHRLLGGDPQGLVLPPHVFVDVTNRTRIAKLGSFGPIAPIIRARGDDEALAIANEIEHGLSSAVFTRDYERGLRFAQRLEVAMAHVNDQPVDDLTYSPFGSEKNPGIGRLDGRWAGDAFTTEQWISGPNGPRQYPFDAQALMRPGGAG